MATTVITKDNFQSEVLDYSGTVLIDFWADWCGPCRMLSPIIAQIAEEKASALKVGKINVDEEPTLAARFGVSSIPLVVKFVGGKPVASAVGYMPKKDLERMLGI